MTAITRNGICIVLGLSCAVATACTSEVDSGGTGTPTGGSAGGGSSGRGVGGASGQAGNSGNPSSGGTTSGGAAGAAANGGASATGGVDAGGAGGTSATGGAAGAPAGSSGCGKAAPATGTRTLMVTGVTEPRSYLLDIPPSYDSSKPYRVVFGFHGATSSAAAFRSRGYGNLPAVAGNDAILVHGEAMLINGSSAWSHASDIAYFDAVLAQVQSELCVDTARVFATGHSSGGFLTNRLGCERGDKLRAIAPLAGGGPGFGSRDPTCAGQLAVWLEHGQTDERVLIATGEASRDFWLRKNHCTAASSMPTSPTGCVAYAGCDQGFPVHWCVSAGGHEPRPNFTAAGAYDFFKTF